MQSHGKKQPLPKHIMSGNASNSNNSDRRRGLTVRITHADCSPVQQTQYVIRVTDFLTDSYERTVRRPYSEFHRLRFHLMDILKHSDDYSSSEQVIKRIHALPFPPKRLFGSKSEGVVKSRAKALHKWITSVLEISTEYRKAQKNDARADPSMSTQSSAMLLDALRTFLTSRVEELNLVHFEKSQSMPLLPTSEITGAIRAASSSNVTHDKQVQGNQTSLPHEVPLIDESPPKIANRSILKSQDRQKPTNSMRKTKTRFSIAETADSFSNNQHNSSTSSSEETQRSSSSSTAPSSVSSSFVSNRSGRNKSNATRSSLSKTEMSNASTSRPAPVANSRQSMMQSNHRSSLVKDARCSLARPKVVKRLPAGNETDIVEQAEFELQQKGLSVDTARMMLRYMDRFLVKATQRQPGCYRITPDNWLAIDAERLCTELEEALFDPHSMQQVLHNGVEWCIPPSLEGYIQNKWAVHHNKAMDELDADDDSDDDLEVEYLTKSTRKTNSRFSRHDIDEIELMMSEGNASRSQVKQLRRQLDEGSWDRRGRIQSKASELNDDDDSLGEEEDIDFETYAKRKSQKSARYPAYNHDSGGLV